MVAHKSVTDCYEFDQTHTMKFIFSSELNIYISLNLFNTTSCQWIIENEINIFYF